MEIFEKWLEILEKKLENSGLFWKNKKFTKEKGTVILRIGAPIYGNDPKKVTKDVFEWINLNFKELN